MKKFCIGIITCLLLTNTIFASSLSDLQKKQSEVKSSKVETSKLLDQTKAEKSAALQAVDEFDQQLAQATEEFDVINRELDKTKELLAQTEEELKIAEEKREAQYNTLKDRIEYMYVNGKMGYVQALLNAKSVGDFLNRLEYVNKIIQYDYQMVNNYKENEDFIAQKVNETEQHKLEVQVLAVEQEKKLHSLEEVVDQKNLLVVQLTADEKKYQQQLSDLESSGKELEQLIKKKQEEEAAKARANASANIVYSGGKLAWPLPGKSMTSPYGNRVNPISRKKEFHTGIDIGGPTGTNVIAAADGVVIFAGTKSGYGNVLVVDHGSGLSTMYAHNSKLLVGVGKSVKRGDAIAKCGSTGYSTGPHLHFEVRVNGATTNPLAYLK